MRRSHRLSERLLELRRSLMLGESEVFFVSESLFPRPFRDSMSKWHDLYISTLAAKRLFVRGVPDSDPNTTGGYGPAVWVGGIAYPLRPRGMDRDVYEVAMILIRDGQAVNSAMWSGWALCQ